MLTTKDGGVPGVNTPIEKAPQAANLEGGPLKSEVQHPCDETQ